MKSNSSCLLAELNLILLEKKTVSEMARFIIVSIFVIISRKGKEKKPVNSLAALPECNRLVLEYNMENGVRFITCRYQSLEY